MTAVRLETWGAHAERFAGRHPTARIAAVFARSLHLESGGDVLCLGDPGIGCGPLNAIVGSAGWARLRAAIPPAGATVPIDRRSIRIGSVAIGTCGVTVWRPAPWPRVVDPERLAEGLRQLAHLCSTRAPRDGLARIALLPAAGPDPALARLARTRIGGLRAWLGACPSPRTPEPPPVDLLGLGPGLTPSGDDALCGALVALRAVGWTGAADRLSRAVARAAPAATSPLSGAFLRAAAEGLGAEPLHALLCAALAGRSGALSGSLEALDRIGHTSGWDALAGAVLVLQAFSTSAVQRRGVARPELSL
jgi:hypothetical protein